ncbi:metastasis-associated protein MTA3-like isoform X2 [Amphiura filiformis]|uniref:metastasis-associated protein MTA3-like isoform X2 n=1 Tax=Amphiura filiformis TaxID=82378 RepID=UPI003B218636
MAANMYRVGDYVYFETSSSQPYLIRRIEELNKTASGNVEAKVVCFYRRRDIPSSLIQLADKHAMAIEEDQEEALEELSDKQRHQLKHRELFLSRQLETLPATHIRGKCTVTLLNETESLLSYLGKDDAFFYSLVYDPQQKTLLADKGEIRVGPRYQAEVPPKLKEDESDGREQQSSLETKVWNEDHNLADRQIDQFMVLARSVGTFGRALDCSSSVRQPSLHMSAAAASRDITLFHAMDVLARFKYDIAKAVAAMVPPGGPVICRDQLEEWSASEANLFEEALEKYGKDFNDIRQDFLPWKTLKSIVEYYYMWKTTDRYVQQKRLKAAEAESKLKQVYIPNYNKPNPNQITNKPPVPGIPAAPGQPPQAQPGARACESCFVDDNTISANSSYQWYSWGPANMQCRLCATCWVYWKKCGGLKMPTRIDGERPGPLRNRPDRPGMPMGMHRPFRCTISGCGKEFKLKAHLARHCQTAHGLTIRTNNPRALGLKTRQAFFLLTTPLTRLSRHLCKNILHIHHAARNPFDPINIAAIKQECLGPEGQNQLPSPEEARKIKLKPKTWPKVDTVVGKISITTLEENSKKAAARAAAGGDRSGPTISSISSNIMRKRNYEHTGGSDGGPSNKRLIMAPQRHPGKREDGVLATGGEQGDRVAMQRKRRHTSWLDAPDDVYFHADENTRNMDSAEDESRPSGRPIGLLMQMQDQKFLRQSDEEQATCSTFNYKEPLDMDTMESDDNVREAIAKRYEDLIHMAPGGDGHGGIHETKACQLEQKNIDEMQVGRPPGDVTDAWGESKRQRSPHNWKSRRRHEARSKGLEYISSRGKYVEAKKPQQACSDCRFRCSANFTEVDRNQICSEFYALANIDRQRDYVCTRVEEKPKKRSRAREGTGINRTISRVYWLIKDGNNIRVCQRFFTSTLAISEKSVRTALEKGSNLGFMGMDQRGRHEPKNKTPAKDSEGARNHIASSIRTFLDRTLTVKYMWETLYPPWCRDNGYNPVSLFVYRSIFNSEFRVPDTP